MYSMWIAGNMVARAVFLRTPNSKWLKQRGNWLSHRTRAQELGQFLGWLIQCFHYVLKDPFKLIYLMALRWPLQFQTSHPHSEAMTKGRLFLGVFFKAKKAYPKTSRLTCPPHILFAWFVSYPHAYSIHRKGHGITIFGKVYSDPTPRASCTSSGY